MNVFTWIVNLGVILLAVGIFLCSFHALSTLVEVAARLWKRMFVSWATRRLTDLGIVKTEEHHRQKLMAQSCQRLEKEVFIKNGAYLPCLLFVTVRVVG